VHFTAYTTDLAKTKAALPKEEYDRETGKTIFKTASTKNKGPIVRLSGERISWIGSLHKSYKRRTTGINENISVFKHTDLIEEIEDIANTYSLDFD
jgi:hypothetical protein